MSKKNKSKKPSVPSSVAAAMRAANQRGSYGSSIAAKEMARAFGAMTLAMHKKPAEKMRSPKRKLSAAEKAARKRALAARRAYATAAARAARLPGKKKRKAAPKKSRVAPRKKVATRAVSRVAAAPKPRRASKKVPTVTAASVINNAQKAALKRWLCEGARRSGCGAGGSRVVTGKGSFVRLRPPRFMTAG